MNVDNGGQHVLERTAVLINAQVKFTIVSENRIVEMGFERLRQRTYQPCP